MHATLLLASVVRSPHPRLSLAGLIIVLGFLAGPTWTHAEDTPGRPNFLMISVDDLNDWVGYLKGHPLAHTPHLDRLASQSVRFTRAYCAAPACGPSRAALFTGRMPHQTGMYSNGHRLNQVYPQARYFHQHLAEAGYHTLGTGKLLHGNQDGPASFQTYGPGFNKWLPLLNHETSLTIEERQQPGPIRWHSVERPDGFHAILPLNRMPRDRNPDSARIESFDWGVLDRPDSEWSDTQCADWAVQQLQAQYDRPFFLGVGFYRPHQPLWAPKRFHDRYPPDQMPLPPAPPNDLDDIPPVGQAFGRLPLTSGSHATVVAHDQWQAAISAYLACITYVDEQIGRVLAALDASPHASNTVVILWTDHGWHLGEKEHWGKFTAWERSARVPLLIRLPQEASDRSDTPEQRGRDHQDPVSLVDLAPTILELAKTPSPTLLDGTSLVPILRSTAPTLPRTVLTTVGQGNHSLRNQRWRYIQYFDGSQELYDLQRDPNEHHNLAETSEHQRVLQHLRTHLPQDTRIAHLARIGGFKAIVRAQTQAIEIYEPGTASLEGARNQAKKHPHLVQRIRDYLITHPNAPRNLDLSALDTSNPQP